MKSLTRVFVFMLLLVLAGFTAKDEIMTVNTADAKPTEETITVNEVPEENTTLINYIDKGFIKASWYGPGFHGRLTANGEIYDQESLTAAHKTMRFGTLLRITNPRNGKSVIVRINDRGPYIEGREIDLSKGAARELGMLQRGVAKVKVELITLQGANFPKINFD